MRWLTETGNGCRGSSLGWWLTDPFFQPLPECINHHGLGPMQKINILFFLTKNYKKIIKYTVFFENIQCSADPRFIARFRQRSWFEESREDFSSFFTAIELYNYTVIFDEN